MNKLERAALNASNKIIRHLGGTPQDKLLPGEPRSSSSCPISNTIVAGLGVNPLLAPISTNCLGVDVYKHDVPPTIAARMRTEGNGWQTFPIAPTAQEFVIQFDCGKFPDLESE